MKEEIVLFSTDLPPTYT